MRLSLLILSSLFLLFACQSDDNLPQSQQWWFAENPRDTIQDLSESSTYIWAATQNNGLLRIHKENRGMQYFTPLNSNIGSRNIQCVLALSDDEIWVGSGDEGLYHLNQGQWSSYSSFNSALGSNQIKDLCYDQNGKLWIATSNGLNSYGQGQWMQLDTTNSSIPDSDLTRVACFEDEVWIGTTSGGIASYRAGNFEVFDQSSCNLSDNYTRSLFITSEAVWFSSFYKYYQLSDERCEAFDRSNSGILSPAVNDLFIADDRRYFATHEGFSMEQDASWSNYSTGNSAIPHDIVETLLIDSEGSVWLGTFGGLSRFKP
jgi:ligand-binding sensor domain-containing protein